MSTKEQILPWTNGKLETLLKEVISHGTELAKIDFKTEIESSTQEQKADLLKDIVAIANTYDDNYEDHGFIIYGVKAKTITGITQTETDTDKFQNNIEQLLRTYISPMPQIYVTGFETDGKKWGAIVIPPGNAKPHMFFKDFVCGADRSRSRKKGEWFVRRGSTTDHGIPEDLTKITQSQMERNLEPLRESIRTLQVRIAKTEEQYNSALFRLVERALKSLPEAKVVSEDKEEISSDIGEALGMNLPTRLKQKLHSSKDKLAEDLIIEAKIIREYIEGADSGLPWAPQLNNIEGNKKIISDLEEKVRSFVVSTAIIILNDNKGIYTDALMRALKVLAKSIEVPSGVQYNRIGEGLRYYPLYLILYVIFICGVASNRGDVLKRVLDMQIKHRSRDASAPITDLYFYTHGMRALINDAYTQRWCEPVAQRIRQVIGDQIGEMITDYSEQEYFFRGEFVLSLTNIDKGIINGEDAERRVPLGGLYLYFHEAHEPILDFVRENPDWFSKLFTHSLKEILNAFDQNADKMTGSGCIAIGMHGLKTAPVYEEILQKKAKK
ncbi:MAG: ATP-binding protein [Candidatus Paceibacterota bacterium]|jgi:hypothetical protein